MRVAFVLRSAEVQPLFRRFVRDTELHASLLYVTYPRSTHPPQTSASNP